MDGGYGKSTGRFAALLASIPIRSAGGVTAIAKGLCAVSARYGTTRMVCRQSSQRSIWRETQWVIADPCVERCAVATA
jgi:hypothetical protein